MENNALYPKYRWVMAVLINIAAQFTHIIYIILSPLLVYLAADFGVDTATAGYVATVHMLTMGIFMFAGTIMVGWIDNKRTQITGITIMIFGIITGYFAQTFSMLIFARVLTGMGHGISGACTSSVIAAWFPARERPALITADTLGFLAVTTLTYTCTVPVYHAFGDSWRLTLLAMGGVLVLTDLTWLIFARDNHALNAHNRSQNAGAPGHRAYSGMSAALKRRDMWLYCMFYTLLSIGANGITTYLPQFLQNVRGYSDAAASSIVGVASGVGVAFTFLGGVAATALGRRKPIILPCVTLCIAFLTLSLVCEDAWAISACFTLYTVFNYFRCPASGTIPTELPGATPPMAASAASMSHGLGLIGSFVASPLLRLATAVMGEEYSMLVFVPLIVGALVFAILLPETGPGRKKSKNAA